MRKSLYAAALLVVSGSSPVVVAKGIMMAVLIF